MLSIKMFFIQPGSNKCNASFAKAVIKVFAFFTRQQPCWAEDTSEPRAAGSVPERLSRQTKSFKESHVHSTDPAGLQHGDEGTFSGCLQVSLVCVTFTFLSVSRLTCSRPRLPSIPVHQWAVSLTGWSCWVWQTSVSWFVWWRWRREEGLTPAWTASRVWRDCRQNATLPPASAFSPRPSAASCPTALLLTDSWWRFALRLVRPLSESQELYFYWLIWGVTRQANDSSRILKG